MLADLGSLEGMLERTKKQAKGDKELLPKIALMERFRPYLIFVRFLLEHMCKHPKLAETASRPH